MLTFIISRLDNLRLSRVVARWNNLFYFVSIIVILGFFYLATQHVSLICSAACNITLLNMTAKVQYSVKRKNQLSDFPSLTSQKTVTMFVGVVALRYQHHLCCMVLITECHNSHKT